MSHFTQPVKQAIKKYSKAAAKLKNFKVQKQDLQAKLDIIQAAIDQSKIDVDTHEAEIEVAIAALP